MKIQENWTLSLTEVAGSLDPKSSQPPLSVFRYQNLFLQRHCRPRLAACCSLAACRPVDTFGGYQTQFTPNLVRPDRIVLMLKCGIFNWKKLLFKRKISFALQLLQPRKLIPNYESFWQNYSQNILALNYVLIL